MLAITLLTGMQLMSMENENTEDRDLFHRTLYRSIRLAQERISDLSSCTLSRPVGQYLENWKAQFPNRAGNPQIFQLYPTIITTNRTQPNTITIQSFTREQFNTAMAVDATIRFDTITAVVRAGSNNPTP